MKIDHVLNSCIVEVVCAVKVVGTQSTSRVQECMALNLDSNKFRSFNHREELDSTVQFKFSSVACCPWCVQYIAQGSLYYI